MRNKKEKKEKDVNSFLKMKHQGKGNICSVCQFVSLFICVKTGFYWFKKIDRYIILGGILTSFENSWSVKWAQTGQFLLIYYMMTNPATFTIYKKNGLH